MATNPLNRNQWCNVTPAQRDEIARTAGRAVEQTCLPRNFTKRIIYDGSRQLDSMSSRGVTDKYKLSFTQFLAALKVTPEFSIKSTTPNT